jgi:hypothetical protein
VLLQVSVACYLKFAIFNFSESPKEGFELDEPGQVVAVSFASGCIGSTQQDTNQLHFVLSSTLIFTRLDFDSAVRNVELTFGFYGDSSPVI